MINNTLISKAVLTGSFLFSAKYLYYKDMRIPPPLENGMSLVKKIALGLISLIIIIALFMPLGISFWLQANYPKFIANINKQSSQIQVKLEKFKRGWFHSTAVVSYYPAKQPNNKTYAVITQQTFLQGPFIFSRDHNKTEFHFAIAMLRTTSSSIKAMHSLHATISFNGNIHTYAHIKKAEIKLPVKGLEVKIKNLNINSTANIYADHVVANITAKKFKIIIPSENNQTQQSICLRDVTIATKQENLNTLPTGFVNIDAKEIIANNNDGGKQNSPFTINNLNIKTQNELINNKINSNLIINIKSITPEKQTPLGPLQIDMSIKNADANAILKLRNFLQQEKNQANTTQKNEDMMEKLLLNIASKGLTLTVNNASVATANNKAAIQANVEIPKLDPKTAALEITKKHHVKLQLQISQDWLVSLLKLGFSKVGVTTNLKDNFYQQQIIPVLIKNNLIKQKDDNSYYTEIQLNNRAITILGNKESNQQLSKTIADIMNEISNQSQESVHKNTAVKAKPKLKKNAATTQSKSK
jgi:hypothetical protein